MKNIVIRDLRADDLQAAKTIFNEFVQHHVQYDSTFEKVADADQLWADYILESDTTKDDFKVLIADLDGQVVGFCLGYVAERPPIYKSQRIGMIGNIAVKQSHKRQGIGHLLFDEIKTWFKSQDIALIETEVAISNPQSMGFWSKVGGRSFITRMEIKI
jgi:ribosomal protein S18 acetylase RimI-like enzyme